MIYVEKSHKVLSDGGIGTCVYLRDGTQSLWDCVPSASSSAGDVLRPAGLRTFIKFADNKIIT